MQSTPWTITGRWIIPIEGPPLERGRIIIRGDRILAVEVHGRHAADLDVGNAAILPGLVNAHTHLDLSGCRGQIPPSADFTGWLRAVIRHRRSLTADEVQRDVRAGLTEILVSGTTLIGDISRGGISWPILADAPLRAVVFHELLGLPRERARQAWSEARTWLSAHAATSTCRPGLSPHAPYSVRASLFRTAASFARKQHLPLAIHLAETAAERELLAERRGPFVAFLKELGVWDEEGLVKGSNQLLQINRQLPECLFIHGNYLPDPISLPGGGTIVYCPRTHAAFGHPTHPFVRARQGGIENRLRVVLGTDSLASNPDLHVLEEARFVHDQFPEIDAAELLHMVTLAGAQALGWHDETGSLRSGKSADLIVLPLASADDPDPHRLVLESPSPVQKVLFRGQWVHERKS